MICNFEYDFSEKTVHPTEVSILILGPRGKGVSQGDASVARAGIVGLSGEI